MRISITEARFDPIADLSGFNSDNTLSGAVASFVGRCRTKAADGAAVEALELQHYPGFTEREIRSFLGRLVIRTPLDDVLVVHRVGRVAPGEAIVLVAAAAAHRAEALGAVESVIDFLKTDAPFWKREFSSAGAQWIEPTAIDYRRRHSVIATS